MNVALMDRYNDGYGVYATPGDAASAAARLKLTGAWLKRTDAPVNNGDEES